MRKADITLGTEALAKADAFASFGLSAREAFWHIKKMAREQFHKLPLFDQAKIAGNILSGEQDEVVLPEPHYLKLIWIMAQQVVIAKSSCSSADPYYRLIIGRTVWYIKHAMQTYAPNGR